MGDSVSLIGFLVCCILILGLALYVKCRRCAKLEKENRIFRWFFEQQMQMDDGYRKTYQAMSVEATRAKTQSTVVPNAKFKLSSIL